MLLAGHEHLAGGQRRVGPQPRLRHLSARGCDFRARRAKLGRAFERRYDQLLDCALLDSAGDTSWADAVAANAIDATVSITTRFIARSP
jgi:hypothetical protein